MRAIVYGPIYQQFRDEPDLMEDDLATRSLRAFCDWAVTRSIGCMFARAMFRHPSHYGIQLVFVPGLDGATLADQVVKISSGFITMPECEGAVLVFDPSLNQIQFRIMFEKLATSPGWEARRTAAKHNGETYELIGLDVDVGIDQGQTTMSEIVGFAPFEYLPPTRRAPTPTLSFRTKPTMSDTPLPGRSERRANLAAIKFEVPTNAFSKLWDMSKMLRKELDGEDNPIARARIAFAFPLKI